MTTEFESETASKTEHSADKVLEEGRTFAAMARNNLRRANEQQAMGQEEKAAKWLRRAAYCQKELDELVSENPDVPWPSEFVSEMASSETASTGLPRAIVLAALIVAGIALLSVVIATGANWYHAEMLFALAAYLVWQHF